ncbi:NAD(P)-dependent oxidoreductase [Alishewanella tabrizica]|uniref:NAD(P)-dependent oxidoreductase n=2 Tax=Alishewanella tabrizica TaxID=671278 RepID=A0ABQ2WHV3_9ALTE|nr:NAD(P)-dependent oxidoreductase [Alishewanella tabrizica]
MNKKIIIVGCGWLGQQIAPAFNDAGWQVYGSRRNHAAAQSLASPILGITLPLDNAAPSAALLALFKDAWVICAIPPGGRAGGTTDYLVVLKRLALLCQQAGSKGGIHISSTGVYQGLTGEVDETAVLQVAQPRVALLAEGEEVLRDNGPWLTLRLSGLMGPGRHPGRFVQGKTLSGAAHPLNMVHSNDVANAILAILQHWPLPQPYYNLSAPQAVSKATFYQAALEQLGSTASINFTAEPTEHARRVLAMALSRDTGFSYQFPDAIQALAACDVKS